MNPNHDLDEGLVLRALEEAGVDSSIMRVVEAVSRLVGNAPVASPAVHRLLVGLESRDLVHCRIVARQRASFEVWTVGQAPPTSMPASSVRAHLIATGRLKPARQGDEP
jgi:hypothetical protein